MDMFDAYTKYVKPEDDAVAAAQAEAAKQEAGNLWDDNQPPTNTDKSVIDQPGVQDKNVSRETSTGPNLSETDIDAIARRLAEIMGQKGGSDGNTGNC